jgi:hypothetical protein
LVFKWLACNAAGGFFVFYYSLSLAFLLLGTLSMLVRVLVFVCISITVELCCLHQTPYTWFKVRLHFILMTSVKSETGISETHLHHFYFRCPSM